MRISLAVPFHCQKTSRNETIWRFPGSRLAVREDSNVRTNQSSTTDPILNCQTNPQPPNQSSTAIPILNCHFRSQFFLHKNLQQNIFNKMKNIYYTCLKKYTNASFRSFGLFSLFFRYFHFKCMPSQLHSLNLFHVF
jgi:hypothetical protein